jgi:hypothetical protein
MDQSPETQMPFNRQQFPHLNDQQWKAVNQMFQFMGPNALGRTLELPADECIRIIDGFLRRDSELQDLTYQQWASQEGSQLNQMRRKVSEQEKLLQDQDEKFSQLYESTQSLSDQLRYMREQAQPQHHASQPRVKLEVTPFKGKESESLLRWKEELRTALEAAAIHDASLQVAFALSKLSGRARDWAYGKRIADPEVFPDIPTLYHDLEMTFQPPRSEFRLRAKFLSIKQGNRTLHEFAQEARSLVSSIMSKPIDDATQVAVFLNGLRDGPVRNQLFREKIDDLDKAIQLALAEDFSARQAKMGSHSHSNPKSRTDDMDCSGAYMQSNYNKNSSSFGKGNPNRKDFVCKRCNKKGHLAHECFVSVENIPNLANRMRKDANSRQGPQRISNNSITHSTEEPSSEQETNFLPQLK